MGYKTERKKQKTEKRTHFAVTEGGETTYKKFYSQKKRVGTKFGSKFAKTTILVFDPTFRLRMIKIIVTS